jgi:hypothetical protein
MLKLGWAIHPRRIQQAVSYFHNSRMFFHWRGQGCDGLVILPKHVRKHFCFVCLCHCAFEKSAEHNGVLQNRSAWIFDAMALIQSLKNIPWTFEYLATVVFDSNNLANTCLSAFRMVFLSVLETLVLTENVFRTLFRIGSRKVILLANDYLEINSVLKKVNKCKCNQI